MPIIHSNESMPKRPVVMVIYGVPGSGKTSLSNTAKNPLIIDTDRGADRAINRQAVLMCQKWEDISTEIENFKDFDTIVIDTVKSVTDDYLMDYVKRKDNTLVRNQLKAFGQMAVEFKDFVNKIRSMGKDLVLISHAKQDDDGDIKKFSPDGTGSSKELILRIADQCGFLSVVNGQRKIRWEPTERTIGKNVAGLADTPIPSQGEAGFNTALADIIEKTKTAIQKRSNAQKEALDGIKNAEDAISKVETAEGAEKALEIIKTLPKADVKVLFAKLKKVAEEKGFPYNKETKSFENVQN